jgi:hypothetical protein
MKMSKPKGSDHIEDMLEWEKKQYTPWEYAQEGKLLPILKAEGNKKLAAVFFYVQSGICVLFIVLNILNSSDLMENWTNLLFISAYAILCSIIATNYLKKWKAARLIKRKIMISQKK